MVALLRPGLRDIHYYARVSVLLSLLVLLMVLVLTGGRSWHLVWMERLSYFPLIALCLTSDSFAKMLDTDGPVEAVWRAITTTAVGLVIAGIASIHGVMQTLIRFPELLIAQIACVLFISEFMNYRLYENRNLLRQAIGSRLHGKTTPALEAGYPGIGDTQGETI